MGTLIEQDERLLAQVRRHEGSRKDKRGRHVAYRCPAGALTIGYGHNLDANPIPGLGAGDVLDEAEARALLADDVTAVVRALEVRCPAYRHLTTLAAVAVAGASEDAKGNSLANAARCRAAVLVNMAFNLGVAGLLTFRRVLGAVEADDYEAAASFMMCSRWASQVGRRAVELSRQMRTGEWQGSR